MPTVVACPQCGKQLKVRDELLGKKLKCPCGGIVATAAPVQPGPPAVAPKPAPPPVPAEEPAPDIKARFRTWKYDTFTGSPALLVLDDEGMWAAVPKDQEAAEQLERDLADADSPEDVVPKGTTFIPYAHVKKVYCNLKHPGVTITYGQGEDESNQNVYLNKDDEREARMKDLHRLLGKRRFRYKKEELGRFKAILAPLGTLVLVVLLTAGLTALAWFVNQPTDGPVVVRMPIWAVVVTYTIGCLGPWSTAAFGGLLAVVLAVWAVIRFVDPPIEVTITPKPAAADEE